MTSLCSARSLQEGHAALEVRILVEPFGDRLGGQQLDLDDGREGRGAALLGGQLGELLVEIGQRERQVRLGDRLAVDGGDHLVRVDSGRRGGFRRRLLGRSGRFLGERRGGQRRDQRKRQRQPGERCAA